MAGRAWVLMGSDDSVLQGEKLDSFDRARLTRLLIVPISTLADCGRFFICMTARAHEY